MKMPFGKTRKIHWESLVVLFYMIFFAIFTTTQTPLIDTYSEDVAFHMSIGQHFEQVDGIATWTFWESPPQGRANIYPPLFGLVNMLIAKTGIEPITHAMIMRFIGVVIATLIGWLGVRLLYSPRAAMFFVLIVTATDYAIRLQSSIVPASLVIFSTPLLIYLIQKKRLLGSVALLTLILYTHMTIPVFVVTALAIWGVVCREHFKTVITTLIAAGILYSPWLLHIIINFFSVKYFNNDYAGYAEKLQMLINVELYVLIIAALVYCVIHFRKPEFRASLFFAIFFCLQIPLTLYNWPNRFFLSGGLFSGSVLIAFLLDYFISHYRKKLSIIFAVVVIGTLHAALILLVAHSDTGINWGTTRIQGGVFFKQHPLSDTLVKSGFDNEAQQLANQIREKTEPDDIIVNLSTVFDITQIRPDKLYVPAQLFAALSYRAMGGHRAPEVFVYKPVPFEKGKVLLVDYRQTNEFKNQKTEKEQKIADIIDEQFSYLGEYGRLQIFINNSDDVIKATPTGIIFPSWLAIALLLLGLGTVVNQVYKATTQDEETI